MCLSMRLWKVSVWEGAPGGPRDPNPNPREWRLTQVCAAEGRPPAAPAGVHASETDRTYVVLSWKAPATSSKAPMWYYIEKVGEWVSG